MQVRSIEINQISLDVFHRIGIEKPSKEQLQMMNAVLLHLCTHRQVHFDARLSEREKICLQSLADGKSLEQIAVIMHIKRTTVATFIKRIKQKLDCDTLAQAVFRGIHQD